MRLIDADKLIEEGYVLTKYTKSGCLTNKISIADVPSAYEEEEHKVTKRTFCKVLVWLFFVLLMTLIVSFGYVYKKEVTLYVMACVGVGLLSNVFYDITRWLFKEEESVDNE